MQRGIRRTSPQITKADEVEIFEPILGDSQGHVTTGLADRYALPEGQPHSACGL